MQVPKLLSRKTLPSEISPSDLPYSSAVIHCARSDIYHIVIHYKGFSEWIRCNETRRPFRFGSLREARDFLDGKRIRNVSLELSSPYDEMIGLASNFD